MSWIDNLSPEVRMAFWTILVASICSIMCALLGVWLVLQRMSLTGDAISHSVLPGLALTFVWFGTRDPVPMMLGAVVAGVLTVVFTRGIGKLTKVREDAGLGVVFTILFAIGVFVITRYAAQIDLDPGCVLYGLVEFVSIDTAPFGGTEVPRALITILPAFAVVAAGLWLFKREIALMAFDPALSASLGKKPNAIYFGLMALVAIATVASFEAVGAILVVAMLIGPAATAQLLTRKLRAMFVISVVLAVVSSVGGYALAVRWNTSVAGMMAVCTGLLYAGAFLWSLVEQRINHRRVLLGDTIST
ncbi:MAG: metal ABC transporter permease [Fimbriimonadaceae bacterium]|nr:metal ABC transporter permease [Fimbriimonadaceae bacterium]